MKYASRLTLILFIIFTLASCGGGGGGGGGEANTNTNSNEESNPSQNSPPVAIAGCRATPQKQKLTGKLQATDSDNKSNELTFSLDPNVPGVAGPIFTSKGEVKLTNVTTGEFMYTPYTAQNGDRGEDKFTFRVDDPKSFDRAVQTIIVNPSIMPLGDSITTGRTGAPNPPLSIRGGYRKHLFDRLRTVSNKAFTDPITGNPSFDFVGSANGGSSLSNFDSNNEGYDGFRTVDLINGDVSGAITNTSYKGIFNALQKNPADIILLHIGTNDFIGPGTPSSVRNDLKALLKEIDRWENTSTKGVSITLYLAKIIDFNPPNNFGDPNEIKNFNNMLDGVKRDCDQGAPCPDTVELVDHHAAFLNNNGQPDTKLYGDKVHPDDDNQTSGYAVMSETWFKKLVLNKNSAADILVSCK